jgi:DNA-binding XRE family transcriptional regulator
MKEPEKRALFEDLERLRGDTRLSQIDAAKLIGVTRRAYIAWAGGTLMADRRVPGMQYAKLIMSQGMVTGTLPICGHDRRPDTAERRRQVIERLKVDYPVNPFSL